MSRWNVLLLFAFPFMTFGQEGFYGHLSATGFAQNDNNPFWIYSNQYGRLDKNTTLFGIGEAGYHKQFNKTNSLELAAGMIARNGRGSNVFIDQFYARYRHKNLRIDLGVWHREQKLHGLSSVGGDILWSGNSRALPGAELQFLKGAHIFDWLTFKGKLGHYFLSDDRYVKNAQVHYKNLQLDIRFSERDKLSLQLSHYAQFGGTSPVFGKQPSGFSDFLKIFTGGNGGAEATDSDQANALGNHLGSYAITYDMQRSGFDLKLYHQTIFEDTSGRELRNFPDGVWGIYLQPKNKKFIDALLYEFVQTVSQSGKFIPPPNGNFRGGDNYFSNGIYQSGWTYKNRIIGLPFIIPQEDGTGIQINRSFVHHLGIAGSVNTINYSLKASFVRNLGTYNAPINPPENAFYSYLGLDYPTEIGTFKAELAGDLSNKKETLFALGLGYSINF
ncbi:MAG TPA: hypothetical protein ENH91_12930 [Leeuwenhoekiella sp.]|nr:hypothetical protein [Leeuwenhoekiella sp.]